MDLLRSLTPWERRTPLGRHTVIRVKNFQEERELGFRLRNIEDEYKKIKTEDSYMFYLL